MILLFRGVLQPHFPYLSKRKGTLTLENLILGQDLRKRFALPSSSLHLYLPVFVPAPTVTRPWVTLALAQQLLA